MHLIRTRRPEETCVRVGQVAANKRVSATAEGELIDLWIRAAEDAIERRTNRAIMRQAYRLDLPFVRPSVTLFRPPMEGSIRVTKARVGIGKAAATEIEINTIRVGVESMMPTATFSTVRRIEAGAVSIEYETGAASADDVPPAVQQAVLLLASHWYSNREATSLDPRARGQERELPYGVDFLIAPFRIPNVNIAVNEAY